MSLDFEIEKAFIDSGFSPICGVDEAGRGPLAGPVTAAAVILPEGFCLHGLDDSKKLSEKKRERLYGEIAGNAVAFSVVSVGWDVIDEINILEATMRAMSEAVTGLGILPGMILVDGNRIPPGLPSEGRAIIGGDGICHSIAAASILAKVTRDRIMAELDLLYPEYGFARHKGYPTKQHYEMIDKYGICEVHRRSFLKKRTGI